MPICDGPEPRKTPKTPKWGAWVWALVVGAGVLLGVLGVALIRCGILSARARAPSPGKPKDASAAATERTPLAASKA